MANVAEIKIKVPKNVANIIDKLIERGYFNSREEFARTTIINALLVDYELGLGDLESDLVPDYDDE